MPQNNSKPARDARRRGAEARQAVFDSLTAEQKLERITARPGDSRRERARLSE